MSEAPPTPERRQDDPKFHDLVLRVDGLADQQTMVMTEVKRNTELTEKIEQSTSGLVEAWAAISGGLKVLNYLGKVAKWLSWIVGLGTAIYTAVHLTSSGIDVPK